MNIAIFQDITTESALRQLEEGGLKYAGLFVDMDNKEERKYVKENAALISGLIKKLDRARIDKSREYKNSVEAEASDIKSRLEEANKPFTLLLDEHKAKRAKILADKKAIEDAKALAIQIEQDHEQAIMEDKIFMIEEAEREHLQLVRDKRIATEAREQAEEKAVREIAEANFKAEQAIINERVRVEEERRLAKKEQERRERDTTHKAAIKNAALSALVEHAGLTEEQAKLVVKAIDYGRVPAVSINY